MFQELTNDTLSDVESNPTFFFLLKWNLKYNFIFFFIDTGFNQDYEQNKSFI